MRVRVGTNQEEYYIYTAKVLMKLKLQKYCLIVTLINKLSYNLKQLTTYNKYSLLKSDTFLYKNLISIKTTNISILETK